MPRYFFDIKDGQDFPDLQGSEWKDLAEAQNRSRQILGRGPERDARTILACGNVDDVGFGPRSKTTIYAQVFR